MSWNGDRVFITGATGFVGANVVRRAISEGADVQVNIRETSDTWRIKDLLRDVTIFPVDLTRHSSLRDAMERAMPDVVIHTAVYGGTARQSDPGRIYRTNLLGTSNLLRSCAGTRCSLFINTGSSSEYGIKEKPMRETDLPEPVNDYGVSKAAATLLCRGMSLSGGIPAVTLRLFSPYGPYEGGGRLVPSVILSALRGKDAVISSREFVRDFIFMEDVLDAYFSLRDRADLSGQVYNIGSGKQHTIGEITDTILRLTGNRTGFSLGRPQAWKEEPAFWEADISHARSGLGWHPHHSLAEGLARTIEWFGRNLSLYPEGGEP